MTATGGVRHLLVINRWGDEFARYHDHIDHHGSRVAYVTTAEAVAPLSNLAEEICIVPALDDRAAVLSAVRGLLHRHGALDRVVALSEFDLDIAAEIREQLDLPGQRPDDVRVLRDKVAMKERVSAAGVRVPRFVVADDAQAVRDLVAEVGLPVILKPRRGAGSQGVVRIDTAADLDRRLGGDDPGARECEEYVAGDILHVDGLVVDGSIRAVKAARYLGTCLGFTQGEPLGSVGVDDPHLAARLVSLTQDVLAALGLAMGAFHLEVIHHVEPVTGVDDLVFLEIGGRVGGAEIPFLWRDVYGLDLIKADAQLQLGDVLELPALLDRPEVAGALRVPAPLPGPCRVVERTALMGRIPCLYEEVLPQVGTVLGGNTGDEEIGGRFRFRGPSSGAVERAVRVATGMYRLRCEPSPHASGTRHRHVAALSTAAASQASTR